MVLACGILFGALSGQLLVCFSFGGMTQISLKFVSLDPLEDIKFLRASPGRILNFGFCAMNEGLLFWVSRHGSSQVAIRMDVDFSMLSFCCIVEIFGVQDMAKYEDVSISEIGRQTVLP